MPNLFQDNHAVLPPRTPEQGYHLSEDLADRAIQYLGEIRSVEPDQPFFLYFAHRRVPLTAPRATGVDRALPRPVRRGLGRVARRDVRPPAGRWACSPPARSSRPVRTWVPAWADLEPEDQAVAARFMECFAGFLSHADAQIGRLLAFLDELGERDNTIVVLVSDNGASAEGGERGSINDARLWNGDPGRPPGAARAHRRDRDADRAQQLPVGLDDGGQHAVPALEARGPRGRHRRSLHRPAGRAASPAAARSATSSPTRSTCCPPILELIGIDAADASSAASRRARSRVRASRACSRSPDAPEHHTTQYFEMLGSRGIYHDGWKAVTFKPLGAMYNDGIDPDAPFDDDVWELYHVAEDFSECHDLAEQEPERLAALVELWWEEARRYQVLPLDNRPIAALLAPRRPFDTRDRYVFYPYGAPIPENATVNVRNRNHTITAHGRDRRRRSAGRRAARDGDRARRLVAAPRRRDGSVRAQLRRQGAVHGHLRCRRAPGEHELAFSFHSNGDFSGVGRLLVDGTRRRRGPDRDHHAGPVLDHRGRPDLRLGAGPAGGRRATRRRSGSPGTLHRVVVEVDGVGHRDPEAEFEAIMAEQ